MIARLLIALLVAMAPLAPASAQTPLAPPTLADTPLPDPAKEAKARDLMHELRCLVCQNQSIADSHADMAGDMRAVVREQIAAGRSPDEVRSWLIERYGNWVTFKPPAGPQTYALWAAPALFLALGLLFARRLFRRRGA